MSSHFMQAEQIVLPLMRPAEVAEILGVAVHTLACWRCDGRGPEWVKFGSTKSSIVRYRPESVYAYRDKGDCDEQTFKPSEEHAKACFVYVISEDNWHHKIGKASNVDRRMKALQIGNHKQLQLSAFVSCNNERFDSDRLAYALEGDVKCVLSRYHKRGEWFVCSKRTAIKGLRRAMLRCYEGAFGSRDLSVVRTKKRHPSQRPSQIQRTMEGQQ